MNSQLIAKLTSHRNLSYSEMSQMMDEVLMARCSPNETIQFLKSLTEKGETDEELLAMLDKMDQYGIHVKLNRQESVIDVCGTGGDKTNTFNISTTAAFVIAASGGVVAKHGNRSISSISGSADIFDYFGYDLEMEPKKVEEIIEKFGIGFMFAQKFHPAMKNVAQARKILGRRTAFNLLGPLSNPARVKNQLVGVYSQEYRARIISLLKSRGSTNVMAVISEDGLDELSTTSKNYISHLKEELIKNYILEPTQFGLGKTNLSEIQVFTKNEAINAFVTVLNNTATKPKIDIVALNSAAGLIVGGLADTFEEGLDISMHTIKSGKAYDLLKNFVKAYGNIAKIEELENR